MRGGQQVGRQDVAAARGLAVTRRKVVGQAVTVEVTRDLPHHALPQRAVTQAHRLAGFLLQASEGVAGKPVTHAVHAFGEFGLQ